MRKRGWFELWLRRSPGIGGWLGDLWARRYRRIIILDSPEVILTAVTSVYPPTTFTVNPEPHTTYTNSRPFVTWSEPPWKMIS